MWMPPLEDAWQGKVQFWELVFGTWTVYIFLVLWWQKVLKEPLEEWRYAMIVFLGATAFWINHYFLYAPKPTWLILINVYTVLFLIAWWLVAVRGRRRSSGWKLGALLSAVPFTFAYIGFEQLSRYGVENWGMHEFCWMFMSAFGFTWLIWWRGHTTVRPVRIEPEGVKTKWIGAGAPPG